MFCPACKSILIIEEGKCKSCGALAGKIEFFEEIKRKAAPKSQELKLDVMPMIEKKCPKCGNTKAYCWTRQISYADEPEVEFYRCTKCGHTWRSTDTV